MTLKYGTDDPLSHKYARVLDVGRRNTTDTDTFKMVERQVLSRSSRYNRLLSLVV